MQGKILHLLSPRCEAVKHGTMLPINPPLQCQATRRLSEDMRLFVILIGEHARLHHASGYFFCFASTSMTVY